MEKEPPSTDFITEGNLSCPMYIGQFPCRDVNDWQENI
jgi:hypothetical protein